MDISDLFTNAKIGYVKRNLMPTYIEFDDCVTKLYNRKDAIKQNREEYPVVENKDVLSAELFGIPPKVKLSMNGTKIDTSDPDFQFIL